MVMILGFILIAAILIVKYKPVYEVSNGTQKIGYIANVREFESALEEAISNINGENIDSVSLEKEPNYELKLISRNKETEEDNIIAKLEESAIITYKYYAVTLNNKTEAMVNTLEEAEDVVKKIKSEYKGNGLELDLAITEKYTENKAEVKTESIEVAEKSMEKDIEKLIDEKEAAEAIAIIKGINLSVLPVSGTITSRYGESSRRRVSTHTGLDIACSTGTPIKAVAKGKVVFAEYNGSYGNLVKIDHGNGVETWYAHCSSINTYVGAKVNAGDVIAKVGSTGNSTGPHLHLEIRINGETINPQKYLYK